MILKEFILKGVYVYVGMFYSFFLFYLKYEFIFLGVVLDGYFIYGFLVFWYNGGGSNLMIFDFDKCYGLNSSGSYCYYMIYDWFYILSCFKGKVIDW